MSCGGVPLPKPHQSPKRNAWSDGQWAHATTVRPKKLGTGSTHVAEPQRGMCPHVPPSGGILPRHPLQRGILKPFAKPLALRVVNDLHFFLTENAGRRILCKSTSCILSIQYCRQVSKSAIRQSVL